MLSQVPGPALALIAFLGLSLAFNRAGFHKPPPRKNVLIPVNFANVDPPEAATRPRPRTPAVDDGPEWINFVVVSGLPEPEKGERHVRRLRLFALSLTQTLAADPEIKKVHRVRLFVVGDSNGQAAVTAGIAAAKKGAAVWPIEEVEYITLTSSDIMTFTQPLVDKFGLTSSFKYRLWDFGKVWALKLLPKTIKTAIMTDADYVFRRGLSEVVKWQKEQRQKNPKWIMAGVAEPLNYTPKPPNPWKMFNMSHPAYVNSGMFILNMDRVRSDDFLGRMPAALKNFTDSTYFKTSSNSQWPPEQFLFNAALGMYPDSFLSVPEDWVVDCISDTGPWGNHRDTDKFNEAKKKAFMTHYCNDQVGVLLTQQECEMVTDPKQAKHKCKPNSFSL